MCLTTCIFFHKYAEIHLTKKMGSIVQIVRIEEISPSFIDEAFKIGSNLYKRKRRNVYLNGPHCSIQNLSHTEIVCWYNFCSIATWWCLPQILRLLSELNISISTIMTECMVLVHSVRRFLSSYESHNLWQSSQRSSFSADMSPTSGEKTQLSDGITRLFVYIKNKK